MKLNLLFTFSILTSSIYSQTCTSSGGDYDPEDMPYRFECGGSYYRHKKNRDYKDYQLIETCNNYYGEGQYYSLKGKIYFSTNEEYKLVVGADTSTFHCENGTARDKKNIYYKGKAVSNIDKKSFESVGMMYCKDNMNVYYRNAYDSTNALIKINQAKSSSFMLIGDEYSQFAKDSTSVYVNGKVIPTSDPATFIMLEYDYAKDKNNVYYNGEIIEGMNAATFKVIKNNFIGSDGTKLCSGNKILENSDANSFEELQCGYSRDINNVYINGRILDGVDSKTFEILSWGFTKDKNAVYCDNQLIKNADPATFEVLNRKHSKDKNNIFYLQSTVDCDYRSFVVDSEKDYLAKDKNYTYKKGIRKL